jgi:hypothetical protein
MAVDQFYAAATAADVLRSQKELARKGFSAGGQPPVGYRREPVQVGTRYDGRRDPHLPEQVGPGDGPREPDLPGRQGLQPRDAAVHGREEHAVAIWRTASDDGVDRSASVSSWLRRQDSNLRPSG